MPAVPSRAWRLGCVLAAVLLLAGTLLVPVPVHRSAVESEGAIAFTERTVHTEWHGAWSFVGDYVEHFSVLYRGLVGVVLACFVAVLALVVAARGRGDMLVGWLLVLTVGVFIAIGPATTIASSKDMGAASRLLDSGALEVIVSTARRSWRSPQRSSPELLASRGDPAPRAGSSLRRASCW